MKYQSLMVYIDLGQCNESALRIACDLAIDLNRKSSVPQRAFHTYRFISATQAR